MTTDNKIRDEKLQEKQKIRTLSSGEIDKNEYLTDE